MLPGRSLTGNRVPPNCSFELDDVEKDWTWTNPFDLIFSRYMTGCLANPEDYVKKAFEYCPLLVYLRATPSVSTKPVLQKKYLLCDLRTNNYIASSSPAATSKCRTSSSPTNPTTAR